MRLRIRLSRVLRVRALHRARDGTGNRELEKELRRARPTGVGCLNWSVRSVVARTVSAAASEFLKEESVERVPDGLDRGPRDWGDRQLAGFAHFSARHLGEPELHAFANMRLGFACFRQKCCMECGVCSVWCRFSLPLRCGGETERRSRVRQVVR